MSETTWTVTTPNGEVVTTTQRKKLAYRPPLPISDKTPKNQVQGAESYNEMRKRLLLLGEMESK